MKSDQGLKETTVTLDFTPLTLTEWQDYFSRVPRSTITQSHDYARAMAYTSPMRPRHGLIRAGGDVVGIAQFMEAKALSGALHVIALDRGPLWFNPAPDPSFIHGFLREWQRLYPRRLGRRRRLILEYPHELMDAQTMHKYGLRSRTHIAPYQTDWLDLTPNLETLRANLDKKWRNILTRGEREAQVNVGFETTLRNATDVIATVIQHQKMRGHRGLDDKTLMHVLRAAAGGGGVLMTRAMINNQLVAGGIFIRHGSCATWQCGFVEPDGRTSAANYTMLWQSILRLKEMGVAALDLGGMNDQDAQAIGHFKKGLGGEHVTLLGTFY